MERSDKKIMKFFSLAFGILFLFIGVIMITVSVGRIVRIISCRRVDAIVAEVIEIRSKPRKDYEIIMYTPIYEYCDGGEIKTYKSLVSTSMPVEAGSETMLYISEKGIIYEKTGTAATFVVGIIFAAFGFLLVFIKVKKFRSVEK